MLDLPQLGYRICIIGPSSSGKSTLGERLAEKVGASVIHLDQLAHHPGTNWVRRDNDDFVARHDAAINQERWVADGNYSICMPQRLQRATAVIWLDPPLLGCIYRYIRRCFGKTSARPGVLENATQEFNLSLIKYTLGVYPKNRKRYERILRDYDIPIIRVKSMRKLNGLYHRWGLSTTK